MFDCASGAEGHSTEAGYYINSALPSYWTQAHADRIIEELANGGTFADAARKLGHSTASLFMMMPAVISHSAAQV